MKTLLAILALLLLGGCASMDGVYVSTSHVAVTLPVQHYSYHIYRYPSLGIHHYRSYPYPYPRAFYMYRNDDRLYWAIPRGHSHYFPKSRRDYLYERDERGRRTR